MGALIKMGHYKNPCEYPYEAFVQQAVEAYLVDKGFFLVEGTEKGYTDIVARSTIGKQWFVEAKGETSDPGLDFKTAVGQIAGRIEAGDANYAIAVPKTPAFIKQVCKLSVFYRKQINLYIILVDEAGRIELVGPEDSIEW